MAAIAIRAVLAVVVFVGLATAALYSYSVAFESSRAWQTCQGELALLPMSDDAEFEVIDSTWPLTPICQWTYEGEVTRIELLDWSYTKMTYGALAVAIVAAFLIVISFVPALYRLLSPLAAARRSKQQLLV